MRLNSSWLAAAAIVPAILAIPTPSSLPPNNNINTTLIRDGHQLQPRAQDPSWQCTAPPPGGLPMSLGTDASDAVRHDPLGQQVGGASPCHAVKKAKAAAINSFWLTDNACAHADKSRYDVIAVFDSPDCKDAGRRVQFDIAATWGRSGDKGFCKKVDFNVRGIQLWQWLPATLPGQLQGTGM